MKVGGKTYTITGGYCKTEASSKTTLVLSLGTVMQSLPFEKSGRPNFLLPNAVACAESVIPRRDGRR